MEKITFKKIRGHFKTIRTHRKWVRKYCFLAGIPWRGITHDLSKYSPTEFWESVRYWTGNGSPIDACKKENGFSRGWLHHKGRNPHHYEYWMDNFDKGGIPLIMQEKDFTEQVCDFLGAARAYTKDKFSYEAELEWWENKRDNCAMHPLNKCMLDTIFFKFSTMTDDEVERLLSERWIQYVWRYYVENNS